MKSKIMKMLVAALALASFGLMGCEEKEAAYSDKPVNITVKDADGPVNITVKDADGNEYPTVKIGQQIWMAKNLNVNVPGSECYENYPAFCEKYGRLYTWEAAMKACPTGWHLPSTEEFETLLSNVGFSGKQRGENLRAASWKNGADKFGFSALPAGFYFRFSNVFLDLGNLTHFWSSTEDGSNDSYYLFVSSHEAFVRRNYDKLYRYSVRCLQD